MNSVRGFTLLELLISLALIGLMVLLLFGALRFGGKAWDASEARLERDTTIVLGWRYLSDRFHEARKLSAPVSSLSGPHFFFEGEPEAVEFVAPMPAHLGSGGFYIIRLQKVLKEGREQLLLRRWLYHPEVLSGESELPPWQPLSAGEPYRAEKERPELRAWYSESVLVDEVKAVRFAYYGLQEPTDEEGQWSEEWVERKQLPLLVRLQVEDARGAWPEMTFELPAY
ncbi:MAG TPA: prepilin-type N-terminal cleavage/methylation domain-containing protein [Chromatiaceae bacterium]|nr:prepilin-type N-terminal cleavage/methylation domain-containing protein [Chromatiaceae bacterium]